MKATREGGSLQPRLFMILLIPALLGIGNAYAELYGEDSAANEFGPAIQELHDGRIEVRLSDGLAVAMPADLAAQLRLLPAAEDRDHLVDVLAAIVRRYAAHDPMLAAAIGRYAVSMDPARAGAIAQAVRRGNSGAASLLAENLPKREDTRDLGAFLSAGLTGAVSRTPPRTEARARRASLNGDSQAADGDVHTDEAMDEPDGGADRSSEAEPPFGGADADGDDEIRPRPRTLLSSAGLTVETPPSLAASPVQP